MNGKRFPASWRWICVCVALDTFIEPFKWNIVRPDGFFPLALSCTCRFPSCLGNSAEALLVINLCELHCRFIFFLASITNVLVEICETTAFQVVMARLRIVLAVDPL